MIESYLWILLIFDVKNDIDCFVVKIFLKICKEIGW